MSVRYVEQRIEHYIAMRYGFLMTEGGYSVSSSWSAPVNFATMSTTLEGQVKLGQKVMLKDV